MGPEHPGARARPRPPWRRACPPAARSTGRSRVSPTKSLFDSATSTGQPVADQLVEPAGELQRVPGVLAEVVRRVDEDAVRAYAQRRPPARRAPVTVRDHVGHHVVEGGPVRPGPRAQAAGVRADQPGAGGGGDLGQRRVGAGPGVVDQVGAGRHRLASATSARQVSIEITTSGNALADGGDGGDRAADLLGGVDLVARAGLDPADVDDVGALGDRRVPPPAGRRPRRRWRPGRRTSPACGSRSPSPPARRARTVRPAAGRSACRRPGSPIRRSHSGAGSPGWRGSPPCRQRATIGVMGQLLSSWSSSLVVGGAWCSA